MSSEGIKRFLELLQSSEQYLEEYSQSPAEALHGFDLTKEERSALISKDDEKLSNVGLLKKERTINILQKRLY